MWLLKCVVMNDIYASRDRNIVHLHIRVARSWRTGTTVIQQTMNRLRLQFRGCHVINMHGHTIAQAQSRHHASGQGHVPSRVREVEVTIEVVRTFVFAFHCFKNDFWLIVFFSSNSY